MAFGKDVTYMEYDFDTRVDRKNRGNIKELLFTPASVRKKGAISFSGAEFEFKTARPVIDAVKEAAENGLFGFTIADGQYLSHVVWWMENVREVRIPAEWILPVQGTIFSVATAIRLFTKEGEGVIIPTPGYNRYQQAADRLSRKTVFSPMAEEDGVPVLNLADLEEKMARPENKLLLLCNPNNPTGQIIPEETLDKIIRLAEEYQVGVLCDEIFADVVFDGKKVPVMTALGGMESPVISVVSMGKTFSFTGVNHANVLIKNPVLRQRYMEQRNADHFGSIDPMVYAALCGGYTPAGKAWLEEMIAVVQRNNERITAFFAEHMPAVKVLRPDATYVLWIDFSGLGLSEDELFTFFEQEAYFSCDRGEEYYGKPCMARLCTAVPPRELEKSLETLLAAARNRGLAR